jgi:hypothetical protein
VPVDAGEGRWVVGNCRRMIGVGDLLLFEFAGARVQQSAGIYAAALVTQVPLTERLPSAPLVGRDQPMANDAYMNPLPLRRMPRLVV